MKFFLIVIFAFILGSVFIISNNSLALSEGSNAKIFLEKYAHWLGGVFENLQDITGYAISLKWNPENI